MKINEANVKFSILVVAIIAAAFVFFYLLITSAATSIIRIEEPEVYAHFLQELESIQQAESFGVDRTRYGGKYTSWTINVRLDNDVSFHFHRLESIEEVNESINRVKEYVESAYGE